jgi:uncharacterized protein
MALTIERRPCVKTPRLVERHPYWFVALLEMMVIAVYLVSGTVAHLLHLSNLQIYGLANLVLAVVVASLLTRMSWWRVTGFRAARSPRDLPYFVVPFVPMVVNWLPGFGSNAAGYLVGALALALTVGFVEEAVFRGLMVTALRPRGEWRAVLVPAGLFGLTHALNVIAGKSGPEAIAQVAYAAAIGFAFGALLLRKGILWPLVLSHGLIDFAHFIQKPGFELGPAWTMGIVAGMAVLFAVYGVWMMRERSRYGEARA